MGWRDILDALEREDDVAQGEPVVSVQGENCGPCGHPVKYHSRMGCVLCNRCQIRAQDFAACQFG